MHPLTGLNIENYSLQQQDESIENHTYVGEEVLFLSSGSFHSFRQKYPFVLESLNHMQVY